MARKELDWYDTRAEALAAEQQAVASEDPKYNAVHHPDRGPALLKRCEMGALRWARGRERDPYPETATWADVVGDLTLEQVRAAIATLHLAKLKTPPELGARLAELIEGREAA